MVFGSGPQAVEHVEAISRIRELEDIRLIGRTPERARPAVEELRGRGFDVSPGEAGVVGEADIIVCATSSAEPLFDHALIRDGACVAAMGSHQPTHRELPAALLGRSLVVVEDQQTALREAGDVVLAIEEGALSASELRPLAGLVRGMSCGPRTDRMSSRAPGCPGRTWRWPEACGCPAEGLRLHRGAGPRRLILRGPAPHCCELLLQLIRQLVEAAAGVAEAVQGHGHRLLLHPVPQLHAAGGGDGVVQQGDLRAGGDLLTDLGRQVPTTRTRTPTPAS